MQRNKNNGSTHSRNVLTECQRFLPLLSARSEKVKLTKPDMELLFENFGTYILMKAKQLQDSSDNLKEYQVLTAKIKELTTSDEIMPLLTELEALEEKNHGRL